MWEFLGTDIGKIVLGAVLGSGGVLIGTLSGGIKETIFEARKRKRDAQYVAIRVVCVLDGFVNGCHGVINELPHVDSATGEEYPSTLLPEIEYPTDVDWRSLKTELMYDALSLPNIMSDIKISLDEIEDVLGKPTGDHYFLYRYQAISEIGIKALKLISAISQEYRIPGIKRSEKYDPMTSFTGTIKRMQEKKSKLDKIDEKLTAEFIQSVENVKAINKTK